MTTTKTALAILAIIVCLGFVRLVLIQKERIANLTFQLDMCPIEVIIFQKELADCQMQLDLCSAEFRIFQKMNP
jgi:hypothetical protein